MPFYPTPEQAAYEAQTAALMQAHEAAKDEHFHRLNNPLAWIVGRLEQLETEVVALRLRVAATESATQRNRNEW